MQEAAADRHATIPKPGVYHRRSAADGLSDAPRYGMRRGSVVDRDAPPVHAARKGIYSVMLQDHHTSDHPAARTVVTVQVLLPQAGFGAVGSGHSGGLHGPLGGARLDHGSQQPHAQRDVARGDTVDLDGLEQRRHVEHTAVTRRDALELRRPRVLAGLQCQVPERLHPFQGFRGRPAFGRGGQVVCVGDGRAARGGDVFALFARPVAPNR